MPRAAPLLALLSVLAISCLPAAAATPDDWAVRFDGLGPLKIGMRFEQADLAVGFGLQRTPAAQLPTKGCEQVQVPRHPAVVLMFIDDVLERIDVFEAGMGAADGLAVGMPIAQLTSAYPHIDREAHAYEESEQVLTRYPDRAPHDSPYGLAMRYTSDKGKIASIIVGRLQEVRYIEGCL